MPELPRVQDLIAALAERAPLEKAAGWDPVGLQLGDPGASVRRTGICHEVTEAVAAAVESDPVDLLVSYHPLLFSPTTRWLAGATPAGRALRLARAGVAVAVVHTSFDVCRGGASDALASSLGLEDARGFAPLHGADTIKIATFLPLDAADGVLDAVSRAGAGQVGAYTHCSFRTEGVGSFFAGRGTSPVTGERLELNLEPEVRIEVPAPRAREAQVIAALVAAHPYEEPAYDVYERRGDAGMLGRIGRAASGSTLASLAEAVRAGLDAPGLRVAGERDAPLERVAVIPGSGEDFIDAALAAGAQALVTGDLRHHAARRARDRGLALVDPGHAATERPGLRRLRELLAETGPPCASFLEYDPDPWVS